VVPTLWRKVVPSKRRESSANDITPCCRRHDASKTLVWEYKITNFNLIHTHKYQIFTIPFHIYFDIPNNIFSKCCIDKFALYFQESTVWDKEIKLHVWKRRPAREKLNNTDGGLCFYPRSCTCYYLITSCIEHVKSQTMWKYSSVQSSPTSKKHFRVWIFQACLLILLLRVILRWIWIWRTSGMKMNDKWKNLPQWHAVQHKSHVDWPGIEPEPPFWGVGD
jgi:hypothetical protein